MLALMHKHRDYVEAGIIGAYLPGREDLDGADPNNGILDAVSDSNIQHKHKPKLGGVALLGKGKKPKIATVGRQERTPVPLADDLKPGEGERTVLDPKDRRSWHDGPDTVEMWETISKNDIQGLIKLLDANPSIVHMRSGDGRGPLWWAHEFKRSEMILLLDNGGASKTAEDIHGFRPQDLGDQQDSAEL